MLCHNEHGKADYVKISLLAFIHKHNFKSAEEKMSQSANFLQHNEARLRKEFCKKCSFQGGECKFQFVDEVMRR